jgi:PTS system galactitol-specific IIA component
MIEFDKELILLHEKAKDRDEIIGRLAGRMQKCGYIGPDYFPAVLEREKAYPTGVPTDGVKVAIPHAFSGAVYKTGMALAVLDEPVKFRNMADPDEELDVEMVFLMANASGSDEHVDALQELMNCFSRADFLKDLRAAETPGQAASILAKSGDYAPPEDDFAF